MSRICFTVTEWVVTKVLEPVDQWVAQQQQHCKQLPWWNPLKWFCWFVTVMVRVVVWVLREILVPIVRVICIIFMMGVGFIPLVIGAAFSPSLYAWVLDWLWPKPLVTGISKKPASVPGEVVYEFRCHCKDGRTTVLSITIPENDALAQTMAADQCRSYCA